MRNASTFPARIAAFNPVSSPAWKRPSSIESACWYTRSAPKFFASTLRMRMSEIPETDGDPWIAVPPPKISFTSAYFPTSRSSFRSCESVRHVFGLLIPRA